MRSTLLPGLAVAAMLLGTGSCDGAPSLPRAGEYLDAAYLAVLTRTQSPGQAWLSDTRLGWPHSVLVQTAGRGRRVALNYGWRAGRILVEMGPDASLRRALAWQPAPPLALRVVDGGSLCLAGSGSAAVHCYRDVGDAAWFVARAVLAGAYVDRQGQEYRFGADGWAHFPGYDFRYAIVLEHGQDLADLFRIEGGEGNGAPRFMAFRRQGGMLTLYGMQAPTGGGHGTPDFGHPLAVLRRSAVRPVLASK